MAASTKLDGRLWLLQERLKQEHLFVSREKESIQHMNTEIQSTCEKLFHLSWIAGQQWRNLQRLQANPSKASQANSLLENAKFLDSYKAFGHLESKYGEFLKGLRENPRLLASTLAFVDRIKVNIDIRQVVRLVLNSLYGNCLLPEDENYVLMLMKSLMEFQILKSEDPLTFFRSPKNWSFTVMFSVMIEGLFSAKLYLTAALHTQILQILAKDSQLQSHLPFSCTKFVQSLEEKLYCFPPSLRWLVCQLFNVLRSSMISERQAKAMVSELIFNYLICPAIINPEPYGINSDMQVSKTARLNLQQISSLLCKSCTAPWQDNVVPTGDIFNSIDLGSIASFVDAILEGADEVNDFPEQQTLPGLCRTSILITENEMKVLIAFMRMVCSWESDTGFPHHKELQELLELLPFDAETPPLKQQLSATIATQSSPSASPKIPHKGRTRFPWKKHHRPIPEMPSFDDDEDSPKKAATTLLTSAMPEVTKAQKYQQECNKRLGDLYQENEDVLVVCLGYSSIESPGMLSEEKVLGIEKPKIKENKKSQPSGSQPFRSRSSSNKFTKLFHEMSIEKDLNEKGSTSADNEIESSGDYHLETIVGSPSVSKVDETEENILMMRTHEPQKVDLVQDTMHFPTNPFHGRDNGPDVVESGSQNSAGVKQAEVDLLIDFSSDPARFSPETSPDTNVHTGSIIDAPLSPDIPEPELTRSSFTISSRSSTISSGSSARDSTFSNFSSLSSGTRDSTVDSGFMDIPEENDNKDNRNSFGNNLFNQNIMGDTSTDDRRSVISTLSRDSYSSGTVVEAGEEAYRSNRDSQVSTLSEDYLGEVQRSGSSSTPEDELDLKETKKHSKAKALKKKMGKRAQTLGFIDKKNKDRRKSLPESDLSSKSERKNKGLITRFRKGGGSRTKQSGARVYRQIDDNTMSLFGMLPTIPLGQFEAADEKTPKDIIQGLMDKYKEVAAMKALEDFCEDKGGEGENDEEEDDVWDEAARLNDTKRKLRLVLCQADFRNLPWLMSKDRVISASTPLKGQSEELMTFLHVQLAEAINLQDRSLVAQLHETIRSVTYLSKDSCTNILSLMEKEYQGRMPYLAYLTRSRQTLLTTQCHLERLIERVQKNAMICKKCFSSNCITLFLEEREKEINTFIKDFRSTDVCPTVDEKSKFLDEFLDKLYTDLERDEAWLGASDDQIEKGCTAIERDIMARVYNDAFYPHGGIDMERDKAFTKHVEQLQGVVGVNHKAIRIPKMYRKEAPWPSAQQELKNINAYKTPKDKLKCVQRCCFTIMNLLNMASASNSCDPAGADEFVPALVCVLIQANPPSLLSTMQYVSNFYEQRLLGEEAWSWMQLCAAIEYTKTIQV
ncbi:GTPase-activating protein and VPS9 domain-containing protein 1-like [Actinia tenebrosa]|uniref:GTPase-activating protein and VPS9 domain-containing protein 1-like n=1 Tax=Actinia tenebrosa TaxID=6105 RepID=A0A6P8HDB2_ACTTE|nr:GTPase-activating protein and VPS9 domain-containing protein 1-like [Actinia tenebrosa]